MKLYYDLHIHSCLSPCGDDDMTPNNIVNMALIKGLDVIAVTDHNTAQNVAAVKAVGDANGLLVVPGMEVQTKEEIHVLCYFQSLDAIEAFEQVLDNYRLPIPNAVSKFGHQWVMDAEDTVISEYKSALILSLTLSLDDLMALVTEYGGVVVPAHINKAANSLLKYLGFVPENLMGYTMEVFKMAPIDPFVLGDSRVIYNSDAHFLEHISEPEHFMTVEEATLEAVLDFLKGRKRG